MNICQSQCARAHYNACHNYMTCQLNRYQENSKFAYPNNFIVPHSYVHFQVSLKVAVSDQLLSQRGTFYFYMSCYLVHLLGILTKYSSIITSLPYTSFSVLQICHSLVLNHSLLKYSYIWYLLVQESFN